MMYIKWLLMVPVMILVTALTFPLAFVLPLFATQQEGLLNNSNAYGLGPRLPKWLSWFQTPDNSLEGDEGWKTEHWQWRYKLPKPLCAYVGMLGWLWRNPGYGYGVEHISATATYTGNSAVNDSPGVEGYCLVKAADLFQLVWIKRISANKCFYFNLGWNIKGLLNNPRDNYTATFAFSPRIATWKD